MSSENHENTELVQSTSEYMLKDVEKGITTITRRFIASEYHVLPNGRIHGKHVRTAYQQNENASYMDINIQTKLFDNGSFVKVISDEYKCM